MIKRTRRLFWTAFIHLRWLLYSFRKQGAGVGQRIPNFTLTDLSARSFTLSQLFPKRAAVLWLTNLCSSCQEKIGLLQDVHDRYGDRLAIFAISTLGSDRTTPQRILDDHHMTFPLLMDPEDWVGQELKLEHPAGACPLYNLIILDRYGRVRFRHHLSALGDEKFRRLLGAVVEVEL